MLKAVKFPAGISNLDTSLTDVDGDALSHFRRLKWRKPKEKIRVLQANNMETEDEEGNEDVY